MFCCIQIHYFFMAHFHVSRHTIFETGTSLDWDSDTNVVLFLWLFFLVFANKDIIFCWVPRQVMKKQTAAKSALDLPLVKVGIPYVDFQYVSQYIFPLAVIPLIAVARHGDKKLRSINVMATNSLRNNLAVA